MRSRTTPALALAAVLLATPAGAWDLQGSLGEGGHQRYVPAISNPLFNETPYITTEARGIYLHNEIPGDFLTGGGDIDIVALELRLAVNDRLGIIATKDGWTDIDVAKGSALPDEDGFANISLGVKYAVLSDPENDRILTVGVEYEAPSGSLDTGGIDLQGEGDGFFDLFVTGAATCGPVGLQASTGVNLAVDGDHDSSMFHFAGHGDVEAFDGFFPTLEVNVFSTIDDGKRTPGVDFEGVDLVNFGSTSSGTVATAAVGARWRVTDNVILGAAYERPITDREDILDWRTYLDVTVHM
jgi:hypothetical protein